MLKEGQFPNNFNFASDLEGELCPFRSHIRKMNPRGDKLNGKPVPDHRILRRGTPYGTKAKSSPSQPGNEDIVDKESRGLMFVCYQSDIVQQFELIQIKWANNPNFLRSKTGIDFLIGMFFWFLDLGV